MKSSKLLFRFHTYPLAILFGLMVFSTQAADAQTMPMRPVARLISNPANESARPRRAGTAGDVNVTPVNSSSLTIEAASPIEKRAFDETNAARAAEGFPPLEWDVELFRMARAHSESMAQQGYFDHETPEGMDLKSRARSMRIGRFKVIAENIAYNKGYDDPGAFAVQRWMLSPGHKANILYSGFQRSAIGCYTSSDGSVYLTQVFITR